MRFPANQTGSTLVNYETSENLETASLRGV
jgi:hypothetical protein